MPTPRVAGLLGRSLGAIRARGSYLGVSPRSEDGRYTASELARELDVPVNTVILWCQRGYLSAEKLGNTPTSGLWRISWDGRSPLRLRPRHEGSTLKLLQKRGLVELTRVQP
jgi:hypothetical protein